MVWPEQARGREVDAGTDIWSLGVVLYGMEPLDGRHTRAKRESDMIVSILERQPTPVTRHAPGAPPELERIVRKYLEKGRPQRYESTEQLLSDLKRLKQR